MEIFYPGYVRKSMSFTIDDGNIRLDRKFLDIVKPCGFLGSFNICSHNILKQGLDAEALREFYRGYELTNHCKLHPRHVKNAKPEILTSLVEIEEGLYRYTDDANRVYYYCNDKAYKKLVDDGKRELEEIFGEGSISAFVWPYCDQKSEELDAHFISEGYKSVRITGKKTDFVLPTDRMRWIYNAVHTNLLEQAASYDALADDGNLKFFCFGIHSHDFENNNCWDVLIEFAEKYGNRKDEFWYATVGEIFEYEDAVKALVETEDEIINGSDLSVYIAIDGKKTVIAPKSKKRKCDF